VAAVCVVGGILAARAFLRPPDSPQLQEADLSDADLAELANADTAMAA